MERWNYVSEMQNMKSRNVENQKKLANLTLAMFPELPYIEYVIKRELSL